MVLWYVQARTLTGSKAMRGSGFGISLISISRSGKSRRAEIIALGASSDVIATCTRRFEVFQPCATILRIASGRGGNSVRNACDIVKASGLPPITLVQPTRQQP